MNKKANQLLAFGLIALGLTMVLNAAPGPKLRSEIGQSSEREDMLNTIEAIKPNTNHGGGGGGDVQKIINIEVCPEIDNGRFCSGTMKSNSTQVCVYWEVQNGIGCCATFGCDYELFAQECLKGDFGLWEMRLDSEIYKPDSTNYDYTCVYDTPWNWECHDAYDLGDHEVTIIQKDCSGVVVDVETVKFNIYTTDNNTFWLTYEVI